MEARRLRRGHAALIVVLLAAALAALVTLEPRTAPAGSPDVTSVIPDSVVAPDAPSLAAPQAGTAPFAGGSSGGRLLATDERSGSVAVAGSASSAAAEAFREKYPAQSSASHDPSVPATNYWALLIGINDYAGSTRDNVGSYQDARDLRKHLLALGWRSDHIVLIANRDATASRIIQGIRWLASKTSSSSVVVFHYSGHERPKTTSSDGDNERRDVALWVADNRLIIDGILGREMNKVRAAKMWIDLAVCRAGGFSDAGMIKSGRVLTFSSPESELSMEDPDVHHSVFGWYLIMEGMRQKLGDLNGDGQVTVEEAYRYARPHVVSRTGGEQHPMITDKLSGSLYLKPPQPAPPPPPPDSGTSNPDCGLLFCDVPRREVA